MLTDEQIEHLKRKMHTTEVQGEVGCAVYTLRRDHLPEEEDQPDDKVQWSYFIKIVGVSSEERPTMSVRGNAQGKTRAISVCLRKAKWLSDTYKAATPFEHAELEHKAEVRAQCITNGKWGDGDA